MKKIFLTGSTSFLGSKFVEMYAGKFEIFGTAKHDPKNPIDLLDFEKLKSVFLDFLPDFVIHTSAIVDQDAEKVKIPNIKSTKNIVALAKINQTPIIFPSSESVYGGKETTGEYVESDQYKPRSVYGETKAESEKIIINSGLNYLIVRCHRFVGFNKNYSKPKQFTETINSLMNNQEVHLDSKKLFKPCLLNNICDVFDHYMKTDFDKKIL
ncbi:MAG: sugar nucleotide-binding protein, partial [bacterium]|nr:sugar nucleotide-binding protein [bacterium]